jgi:hypothetical protein
VVLSRVLGNVKDLLSLQNQWTAFHTRNLRLALRSNIVIQFKCKGIIMKKVLMALSVLVLASCAAEVPVTLPSGVSIDVIDATFAQNVVSLKNCTLKGHVLARTIDRFKPTNLLVTEAELNEIKDKTMYLGANTVVIRQNQIVYNNDMYVHVLNAEAYSCFTPAN